MPHGQDMDKKKKPPPGATLIQRLREARLRREQAEAAAQEAGSARPAPPVKPAAAPGKAKAPPPAVKETKGREDLKKTPRAGNEQGAAPPAAPPAIIHKVEAVPVAAPPPVTFIHRQITINDLRPLTDDYDQLTEEIRLAGRFAAAGLIAQGLRLARLKDDALYKEHYTSFEEYCRTEHSMSATYAYRLIRMAEMAERLAEEGYKSVSSGISAAMPDPFEVMLGLGHRHLMALLPLEAEKAEDLLLHGVPLADQSGKSKERIPITRATEQQIRQAISLFVHAEVQKAVRGALKKAPPAMPTARSVRTMTDLVEVFKDWADWLESEPAAKALADRIGEGREVARLAQQLRKACDRVTEALESLAHGEKGRKR